MWRAVAAGISVIVATASGVVTALATTHPSQGLWAALAVVVIVGAVLQAVVTYGDRRRAGRVSASGAGSVAVGGSAGEIRTRMRGNYGSPAASDDQDGVTASGPGAVGIGGDARGPVSTDVTGGEIGKHDDQA